MTEYGSWDESKGRIADKLDLHEEYLKAIRDNGTWLLRVGIGGLLTLVGHAIMSYLQMTAN